MISLAGAVIPASFAATRCVPAYAADDLGVAPGTRLDGAGRGARHPRLSLNGAPSQIFGCGPPGALAGTTALTLAGTAGAPNGLGATPVSGAAPGSHFPMGRRAASPRTSC